jgi:hypothetical protein
MGILKTFRIKDDGSQILAAYSTTVVVEMRDSGRFTQDEPLPLYMLGFAERYFIESGHKVRTGNTDEFLSDLLAFGYLEELKCTGACLPHGVREETKGRFVEVYCNGCGRRLE